MQLFSWPVPGTGGVLLSLERALIIATRGRVVKPYLAAGHHLGDGLRQSLTVCLAGAAPHSCLLPSVEKRQGSGSGVRAEQARAWSRPGRRPRASLSRQRQLRSGPEGCRRERSTQPRTVAQPVSERAACRNCAVRAANPVSPPKARRRRQRRSPASWLWQRPQVATATAAHGRRGDNQRPVVAAALQPSGVGRRQFLARGASACCPTLPGHGWRGHHTSSQLAQSGREWRCSSLPPAAVASCLHMKTGCALALAPDGTAARGQSPWHASAVNGREWL